MERFYIKFFTEERHSKFIHTPSDVALNAIEKNILQIIQDANAPDGSVEWEGKYPYQALFYPGAGGSRNMAYPVYGFQAGPPLKYYHTLGEQGVQKGGDGNVYIMLRDINPETIVVNNFLPYENGGFLPLPGSS
tara:strand:+ start:234 stop:635 length:402 start_codon:yes stop_codon:yes gene_type:complete